MRFLVDLDLNVERLERQRLRDLRSLRFQRMPLRAEASQLLPDKRRRVCVEQGQVADQAALLALEVRQRSIERCQVRACVL
jgi:hypothetical protein